MDTIRINDLLQNEFKSICFGSDDDFEQQLSKLMLDLPIIEHGKKNIVISIRLKIAKNCLFSKTEFAHGSDYIELTNHGDIIIYKILSVDCSIQQLLQIMYCLAENWRDGIFFEKIRYKGKIIISGKKYFHYSLQWQI